MCRDSIEDEIHFLFRCKGLYDIRESTLKVLLDTEAETKTMSENEKAQWLLDKFRIREFAEILTAMYDARQKIMSK